HALRPARRTQAAEVVHSHSIPSALPHNSDTRVIENRDPTTGSIRTIFAVISMLAFARVGGRALPLDLVPEATWVGVGGHIGSIGASRDSVWNRRDNSGVRP